MLKESTLDFFPDGFNADYGGAPPAPGTFVYDTDSGEWSLASWFSDPTQLWMRKLGVSQEQINTNGVDWWNSQVQNAENAQSGGGILDGISNFVSGVVQVALATAGFGAGGTVGATVATGDTNTNDLTKAAVVDAAGLAAGAGIAASGIVDVSPLAQFTAVPEIVATETATPAVVETATVATSAPEVIAETTQVETAVSPLAQFTSVPEIVSAETATGATVATDYVGDLETVDVASDYVGDLPTDVPDYVGDLPTVDDPVVPDGGGMPTSPLDHVIDIAKKIGGAAAVVKSVNAATSKPANVATNGQRSDAHPLAGMWGFPGASRTASATPAAASNSFSPWMLLLGAFFFITAILISRR